MPEVRGRVRGGRAVGDPSGDAGGDALRATVLGGGLAGCEAAWALAERGVAVTLVEMRPVQATPAHRTDLLAELVCSNSFKSIEPSNAHGLLKAELRLLGSVLLPVADEASVPGGTALTVDRTRFAERATELVAGHARIRVLREEALGLPCPGIVATGPLTSEGLSAAIRQRLGVDNLAFYDAIAPIVAGDSLEHDRLFAAARYGKGEDDFLNSPLDATTYGAFVDALVAADEHRAHDFDDAASFEGCLPVEEMARRGRETLRFGPMKPVGLPDPRTGRVPHAVVQLRREDRGGQMWNLVGFQTRLRIPEQQRVFRMIPGLAEAEFLRYGAVHRNAYLNAPAALSPHLSLRDEPSILFAGQLTGVEGYTESLGTGLLAGLNLGRILRGLPPLLPPPTTMLGALLRYLATADPSHFQPMNANFGLLAPLPGAPRDRTLKKRALSERALAAMRTFAREVGV